MTLLSPAAYAQSRRDRGLSYATEQGIRKAIGRGDFPVVSVAPIRIDPDVADAALAGGRVRLPESTAMPEAPQVHREPMGDDEDASEAKRREAIARADLMEFKRDLEAKRLLDAGEVTQAWVILLRAHRDALLAIPDRIADELSGLDNADDCRALVDREIRRQLTSLADNPPNVRGG